MLSALVTITVSAGAAALFHATLLRSVPAADARLANAPQNIRLVFSEEVVPSLSHITLIGTGSDSVKLEVSNDPHDVHTLLGSIQQLLVAGDYTVSWHVVSADGHPVEGTYRFSIASSAVLPTVAPPVRIDTSPRPSPIATPSSQNAEEVPVTTSLLRGFGLGALMAAIGILFFGTTSRDSSIVFPHALVRWLALAAAVLLVAHLIAWVVHISTPSEAEGNFAASVFRTRLGRIELIRTLLALLTFLSVAVARNHKVSLLLGVACLIVSGAVGHSAAIDPVWAIPAKSIHLLAGALWLGGVLWLLTAARMNAGNHQLEALRVSSFALAAVIAVLLSGLLQTVLFLNSPGELLSSTYGKLVIAKIIGLAVLVAYGAYNRYSLLPRFAAGGNAKLVTSVKQEVFIMSLLIVIGGFLAYIPPPPSPSLAAGTSRGAE